MTTIEEVMTTDLRSLPSGTTIVEAAKEMRDQGIGDILVVDEEGNLAGIVTDRDITVRAVAEGRHPGEVTVDDVCTSGEFLTASPHDEVDVAADVMRQAAVRRLPVVENGEVVGLVSLGDLAIELDPDSALADISEQPPNS
jgi:CBS domain-containing protein